MSAVSWTEPNGDLSLRISAAMLRGAVPELLLAEVQRVVRSAIDKANS